MSKLEETMRRLREEHEEKRPREIPPPKFSLRQRLAIALMRVDAQVSCKNCIRRLRPCRAYNYCLAPERSHFEPKPSIVDLQMRRVNAIFQEIENIQQAQ